MVHNLCRLATLVRVHEEGVREPAATRQLGGLGSGGTVAARECVGVQAD